jgi:hypothetical protein
MFFIRSRRCDSDKRFAECDKPSLQTEEKSEKRLQIGFTAARRLATAQTAKATSPGDESIFAHQLLIFIPNIFVPLIMPSGISEI